MALARKIVSGEEENTAETVDDVFAAARAVEASAEELLVDEGWKTLDVEPEVNGSNGNGRHNATGIEQTVELVLENGHHTNGNGNGHANVPINGNGANDLHPEVPEPQKALFSWADFMTEEPVKPKGRSRKPQPASTSLFEWALSFEKETTGVSA